MSDFGTFLLRLVAALGLIAAWPLGPDAFAWMGALLLLAGFKARYTAAALGIMGLMKLLVMPWNFDTQASWLGSSGTAVLTLNLFAILVFGPGGLSTDEWLHARKLQRAEAHCRSGAAALPTRGQSLRSAVRLCVDDRLMPRSRVLAWLGSPSNPEARAG